MPTFIEKFECGHEEKTQVGANRHPFVNSEAQGVCFWCAERQREIDAADEWAKGARR